MTDRGYGEIIRSPQDGAAYAEHVDTRARNISEQAAGIPLGGLLLDSELESYRRQIGAVAPGMDPDNFLRTRIYLYIHPEGERTHPELDMIGYLNRAVTELRDPPYA